jgi:cytochrome P450
VSRPGPPPRITLDELTAESDPFPTYARLRDGGPLWRGGPGQFLVARHREVSGLLRDPRLRQFQFSALARHLPAGAPPLAWADDASVTFTERILAGLDGAEHAAMRALVGRAFHAGMATIDTEIDRALDGIIAPVLDRGRFDAVTDLAHPLPQRVLGALIGIPDEERDAAGRHALALTKVFSPQPSNAEREAANEAVTWLRHCMSRLLEPVRPPSTPFQERLRFDMAGAPFCHADVVDNLVFLLFAGFETSMNLLADGCAALVRWPDQWRRLAAQPGLAATATEELLRFSSPVHMTGRYAAEPVRVGGHLVSAGRVVFLVLASANRDERQFADPDRLDLGRKPNPHVALGSGTHHCLGAVLARREAAAAFRRLVTVFADVEASGEPVRSSNLTLRSLQSLPLAVTPA